MNAQVCTAGRVADTGTAKGRGVFATRDIAAGEVVEIAPVVMLTSDWESVPDEIKRIAFNWGWLTRGPEASCIVLGWGSLYNHATQANLRYDARSEDTCMVFTAARDIVYGEELTINYNQTNGNVNTAEDAWFTGAGITPI